MATANKKSSTQSSTKASKKAAAAGAKSRPAKSPATKARATKRTKAAPKRAARRQRATRIVQSLPEGMRTARVVDAAKRIDASRAGKELERAIVAAQSTLADVANRLQSLESLAEERLTSVRTRLVDALPLDSMTLDEMTEGLSERALSELDELLERLGLVRIAVVDERVSAIEKKLRKARRDLKAKLVAPVAE